MIEAPAHEPLVFSVWGVPQPQGSMRALYHPTAHKIIVTSDNANLSTWRDQVWATAQQKWGHKPPALGPIQLQLAFALPRPRGHFAQLQSVLRPSAPERMTKRPDLDKLVRAVCDSLKQSRIFKDDAQINAIDATKDYVEDGNMPGVKIVVLFE